MKRFQNCFFSVLALASLTALTFVARRSWLLQSLLNVTRDVTQQVNSIGGVALGDLGLGFSFGRNPSCTTRDISSTGNAMNDIWKTCADRAAADPSLTPTKMLTPEQTQVMQNLMSSHQHRVMHALWHLMRKPLSTEDIDTITQSYGQNGGIHMPNARCRRAR